MIDFSEDIAESQQQKTDEALWVNKYRPRALDDICLKKELKDVFAAQIAAGDIQNVTLVGPPGTGKTTLALVLADETKAEALFISCAAGEGRVDSIASKIIPFCQYSSPRQKIVILDELDSASATQANSFQKSLRNVVETYSDCRFIATANYADNIIKPILSRLPELTLSFDVSSLTGRLGKILTLEKIDLTQIDKQLLGTGLKQIVQKNFPDIRSIIGKLQMMCSGGLTEEKLKAICSTEESDYDEFYRKVSGYLKEEPQVMRAHTISAITDAASHGRDPKALLTNPYEFAKGLFEYALKNNLIVKNVKETLISLLAQLNTIESCIDKEMQVFRFLLIMSEALGENENG